MAGDQFSISTWWQPLGKLFFPGRDRMKKASSAPDINSSSVRGNRLTNFYIDRNNFLKIVAF
jgi:hypothetical protein